MTENEKTVERLLAEIQEINEMLEGLGYYIYRVRKSEHTAGLQALSDRWATVLPDTINPVEDLEKLKNILSGMRELAIQAGASPEDLSDEKLKSYAKLSQTESDIIEANLQGDTLGERVESELKTLEDLDKPKG